jgi:hypothetical protein
MSGLTKTEITAESIGLPSNIYEMLSAIVKATFQTGVYPAACSCCEHIWLAPLAGESRGWELDSFGFSEKRQEFSFFWTLDGHKTTGNTVWIDRDCKLYIYR